MTPGSTGRLRGERKGKGNRKRGREREREGKPIDSGRTVVLKGGGQI